MRVEYRVTGPRGYELEFSFCLALAHEKARALFGEPEETDEEGRVGQWHISVDGDPLLVQLVDPEWRRRKKGPAASKEEVVYIYSLRGEYGTAAFSIAKAVYARYGKAVRLD